MFKDLLVKRAKSLAHAEKNEEKIRYGLQAMVENLPLQPGVILLRMDGKIVAIAHYTPGVTEFDECINILDNVQYDGCINYNMEEMLSLYEVDE